MTYHAAQVPNKSLILQPMRSRVQNNYCSESLHSLNSANRIILTLVTISVPLCNTYIWSCNSQTYCTSQECKKSVTWLPCGGGRAMMWCGCCSRCWPPSPVVVYAALWVSRLHHTRKCGWWVMCRAGTHPWTSYWTENPCCVLLGNSTSGCAHLNPRPVRNNWLNIFCW